MAQPTRYFPVFATPGVLGHRHLREAWSISESYRVMSLGWALESYFDAEGFAPAACPEIPVAGYREPSRCKAFRDPPAEELGDGSRLIWIAWMMSPRIAAQLARVADSLSHRQEAAILGAAYGRWLDPSNYPAPPLSVIDGTVADLRTLRPPRHRRLKAHRARLAAAPELELAV